MLGLVSNLSTTDDELQALQREFIRIDIDKNGSIGKKELTQMVSGNLSKQYNIDWDAIISDIEEGGTLNKGQIDFQQFMSVCVNRKKLKNKEDVAIAFKILDADQDGKISL